MELEFKKYDDIKTFFVKSCHTHNPCEVVLFHDQRDTVHKLMQEVASETGRNLIDKDLSTLMENELGAMKLENTVPAWLGKAMENADGKGCIIYLREFHLSTQKVQNDVMNILIKKDVQGIKFPKNTLIVLGVHKQDDVANSLTHTHVINFFK
jgi:hypothetical protein